ncbi:hypothetical protein [Rhodococcus kronopolitis]|uniref:DUF4124 domain-containing protein n=1 Tax=Rhodococcus kronopolitis TaxID=1460226 RepID=A0ABV9FX19_9NOCA
MAAASSPEDQGYWKVRQIGGGRLEWTDPNGEKLVTVPGGAFCDPDARDDSGPGDRAAATLTGRARAEAGRARAEADLAARGIGPNVLADGATVRRLFEDASSPITNGLEFLLDLSAPRWRNPEFDRVIREFRDAGGDYVNAGTVGRTVTVDRSCPPSPRRPRPDGSPPPF